MGRVQAAGFPSVAGGSGNEAPRPEAEVSGRPPRGGRSHAVAPVGGADLRVHSARGRGRIRSLTECRGVRLKPDLRESPPLHPAVGTDSQPDRGPSRSFGVGHPDPALRRPEPRGTPRGCTPDRSKLFGSHDQRPWFHEVMKFMFA
jgi:hypothetical protein